MAADLDSLITTEIPEGRQSLLDSHTNLERVAEYCENNYFQSENKRAALEETKSYTTQSLASVAYQINTLAYNFLQMLDLQSSQIQEMESQINHISQTVAIHKEKVARREIGVLTTNKCSNRQYKIVAPANPERRINYVRKPIDYSSLDDIGHGVKTTNNAQLLSRQSMGGKRASNSPYGVNPQAASQYGTTGSRGGSGAEGVYGRYGGPSGSGSSGNVSAAGSTGAGPAPTTKPPTPPQNRIYQHGTLTRSSKSEYRTPPVVAPPQVPSNYAPNYPKTGPGAGGGQYGTLPHPPQVGMVYPQPQDGGMGGAGGGATMPRLSSHSMRSTQSSTHSGNSSTPPPPSSNEGSHTGAMGVSGVLGGRNRKISASSNETDNAYGVTRQSSSVSRQLSGSGIYGQYGQIGGGGGGMVPPGPGAMSRGSTPPSQYGTSTTPRQGSKSPSQYLARGDRGSTPPSSNPQLGGVSQYGTTGRPSARPPSPPPATGGPGPGAPHPGPMPGMVPAAQPLFAGGPPGLASGQMLHQQQLPLGLGGNSIYGTRQQAAEMMQYKRQISEGGAPNDTYTTRAAVLAQQQAMNPQGELESTSIYARQSSLMGPAAGGGGSPQPLSSVTSSVVMQESLAPSWVPKAYIEKVVAIYDYNADKEDELTFTEGQIIYVVKKNDDGWWEGVMDGITGLFPGNYVEQTV
eukprot:TRINITY_DN14354_c0_g1_i4.p1 TRINITY_DN14354_c0_g1~~TRINITY_DN14354_c0_g1_i4.p1  ORF type:complete len:687 (-),score=167.82 TRINITY_DN14354_c0_g1_i4:336-2396(-)